MKRFNHLLFSGILIAAIGCSPAVVESPIKVNSEFNSQADYSAFQTWNFAPYKTRTDIPLLRDEKLRNYIITSIQQEMSERGLKQVVQSPDLLIGYHAAVDQIDREQLEQLYEGFDWKIDHQYGDEEDTWNKAALIMFVFDGNTGELLWQASAEAVVMDNLTDEQRLARVRKGVDMMLQELPKKTQQ